MRDASAVVVLAEVMRLMYSFCSTAIQTPLTKRGVKMDRFGAIAADITYCQTAY